MSVRMCAVRHGHEPRFFVVPSSLFLHLVRRQPTLPASCFGRQANNTHCISVFSGAVSHPDDAGRIALRARHAPLATAPTSSQSPSRA
eukprot:252025-Chlamydomonas_euryale.AAC.1